ERKNEHQTCARGVVAAGHEIGVSAPFHLRMAGIVRIGKHRYGEVDVYVAAAARRTRLKAGMREQANIPHRSARALLGEADFHVPIALAVSEISAVDELTGAVRGLHPARARGRGL